MKSTQHSQGDDQIIADALAIVQNRIATGDVLNSPQTVRNFLSLHFAGHEREVFCCLFLTSKHNLIAIENLFYGTIDSATVHTREVVKRALELNASAIIVSHNHPSGVCEPSSADRSLTTQLRDALGLVHIRLLDHIVIGGAESTSLAEMGHI